jgi:Uma2 family endonuclease
MLHRPDLGLYAEVGLRVETYRKGRARPDGALAPRGTFAGQGEWADPSGVLMAVEVTSFDRDGDDRDKREKPRAYAGAGIPVYLLIDRAAASLTVHAEPVDGAYADVLTVSLGQAVALPDPVGISLETRGLLDFLR